MAASPPGREFWAFSLRLYALPGVAPACLSLQDRRGIDVNLLLYALWVGASGRGALDARAIASARRAVGSWHAQVVRPLRRARRALKMLPAPEAAQALRTEVKRAELESERIEHMMLAELAPPGRRPRPNAAASGAAARANLLGLFQALGIVPDRADRRDGAALLAALATTLHKARERA